MVLVKPLQEATLVSSLSSLAYLYLQGTPTCGHVEKIVQIRDVFQQDIKSTSCILESPHWIFNRLKRALFANWPMCITWQVPWQSGCPCDTEIPSCSQWTSALGAQEFCLYSMVCLWYGYRGHLFLRRRGCGRHRMQLWYHGLLSEWAGSSCSSSCYSPSTQVFRGWNYCYVMAEITVMFGALY